MPSGRDTNLLFQNSVLRKLCNDQGLQMRKNIKNSREFTLRRYCTSDPVLYLCCWIKGWLHEVEEKNYVLGDVQGDVQNQFSIVEH